METVAQSPIDKNQTYWAMGAHLGTLLGWSIFPLINFIIPFIIWQIKKDEMLFAAEQAKEALNFQLTLASYLFICLILCLLIIGLAGLWLIPILEIVFTIIATIQVSKGIRYQYPCTLRFIQ